MDVRLSAEQRALRDSVAQVVDRLGPGTVGELDDAERTAKLDAAVAAAGLARAAHRRRRRRARGRRASRWRSCAEELARGLADAPFLGPTLAAELRRLAGAPAASEPETVALSADLTTLAVGRADAGRRLRRRRRRRRDRRPACSSPRPTATRSDAVALDGAPGGSDLTRGTVVLDPAASVAPVADQTRVIADDDERG